MDNDTIIEIVQALVDNELLLIDTGETLADCKLEVHRKHKNNGQEVVLFIVSPKE